MLSNQLTPNRQNLPLDLIKFVSLTHTDSYQLIRTLPQGLECRSFFPMLQVWPGHLDSCTQGPLLAAGRSRYFQSEAKESLKVVACCQHPLILALGKILRPLASILSFARSCLARNSANKDYNNVLPFRAYIMSLLFSSLQTFFSQFNLQFLTTVDPTFSAYCNLPSSFCFPHVSSGHVPPHTAERCMLRPAALPVGQAGLLEALTVANHTSVFLQTLEKPMQMPACRETSCCSCWRKLPVLPSSKSNDTQNFFGKGKGKKDMNMQVQRDEAKMELILGILTVHKSLPSDIQVQPPKFSFLHKISQTSEPCSECHNNHPNRQATAEICMASLKQIFCVTACCRLPGLLASHQLSPTSVFFDAIARRQLLVAVKIQQGSAPCNKLELCPCQVKPTDFKLLGACQSVRMLTSRVLHFDRSLQRARVHLWKWPGVQMIWESQISELFQT